MMRALVALLLMAGAARADMIDYGFNFTGPAQAIADAAMLAGQYDVANVTWRADHVLSGIQCWRPSQDDAMGNHSFLAGYYVIVSVDTPVPIPALLNHARLAFALNRTEREANQPFVTKNNIGAVLADLGCQPLFMMFNPYPIGGFQ